MRISSLTEVNVAMITTLNIFLSLSTKQLNALLGFIVQRLIDWLIDSLIIGLLSWLIDWIG